MPKLIQIPSFHEPKGSITVIEKVIPFDIKRVFYIYNFNYEEQIGRAHV